VGCGRWKGVCGKKALQQGLHDGWGGLRIDQVSGAWGRTIAVGGGIEGPSCWRGLKPPPPGMGQEGFIFGGQDPSRCPCTAGTEGFFPASNRKHSFFNPTWLHRHGARVGAVQQSARVQPGPNRWRRARLFAMDHPSDAVMINSRGGRRQPTADACVRDSAGELPGKVEARLPGAPAASLLIRPWAV